MGYQLKCLELIAAAKVEAREESDSSVDAADTASTGISSEVEFLIPNGPNLQGVQGRAEAQQAAAAGLRATPELAEIYPLGGAQDSLLRTRQDAQTSW